MNSMDEVFSALTNLIKKAASSPEVVSLLGVSLTGVAALFFKQMRTTITNAVELILLKTGMKESHDIRDNTTVDKTVHDLLTELRVTLDCDRVQVFLFKNGTSFISSNKEYKITCPYEKTKSGIAHIASSLVDIPITHVNSFVGPILSGDATGYSGVSIVSTGQSSPAPAVKYMVEFDISRCDMNTITMAFGDITTAYAIPLVSKKGGMPFGIICANFYRHDVDEAEDIITKSMYEFVNITARVQHTLDKYSY